ncbi:MAG: SpaA isopeptide-forming pilin-related protein [Patescibacteria group bacterium]
MKKISLILGAIVILSGLAFVGYSVVSGNNLMIADATGCTSNPEADLTGTIQGNKVTITNKSATCSYKVGLASYKVFSSTFSDQKLFDSASATIAPKATITLTVDLPSCAYQLDAFYGDVITNLSNENMYRTRLLDYVDHFVNYCTNVPPKGCITISKEVYESNGTTRVLDESGFTFKLVQTGAQMTTGTDGTVTFSNVAQGNYVVEELARNGYTVMFPTDGTADITVNKPTSEGCAQFKFKNKKVVTQTPKGCIVIKKETYNTVGNILTPVAQFTFKLDNSQTVQNDANGNARFDNVSVGSHTVSEIVPTGWTNILVTPANGVVNVEAGSDCVGVVFKNKQNPVVAQKGCIVVNKEVYESNGTTRVSDESGFTFKLVQTGAQLTTNSNGSVTFSNIAFGNYVVEELARNGYTVMFPTDGTYDVTVNKATSEGCANITFKNKKNEVVTPKGCIVVTKELYQSNGSTRINDASGFTFKLVQTGAQMTTNSNGTVTFSNLNYGNYVVEELSRSGYVVMSPSDRTHDVNVNSQNCEQITFKNKLVEVPPQKGCIVIKKEAFDTNGNLMNTVAQFTFRLDGGRTTVNDAQGNAYFYDVSVGSHTVTEEGINGWTNFLVTPANGNVQVSHGTNCAGVVFKNKQNPPVQTPNLSGVCWVNPSTAQINQTVTWSASASGGNGSYTYSWSGWDGLSGYGSSVQKQYSYAGQKSGTVVITSGNDSITKTCYMEVIQPQVQNFYGYCTANPTSAYVNETINWSSSATGGNGNYSYSWTGTDGLSSNNQNVSRSYGTPGQKTATVTIYSNGQQVSQTCTIYINERPGTVVVSTETPNQGSGVYLSQIPYTGTGDNFKLGLFVFGLIAWSGAVSYFLIARKARKQGLTVAELINGSRSTYAFASGVSAPIAATYVAEPVVAEPVAIPSPTQTLVSDEFLFDLEQKARSMNMIISADAFRVLAVYTGRNTEHAHALIEELAVMYRTDLADSSDWITLGMDKVTKVISHVQA